MSVWIITVSSITYAIKGQKVLERYGIGSYITRNPNYMGTTGCGYGLKVKGDIGKIRSYLEQGGIKIKQVAQIGGADS